MYKDGTFRIQRSTHSGNKVRYMLGWESDEMSNPVFEPWSEEVVKRTVLCYVMRNCMCAFAAFRTFFSSSSPCNWPSMSRDANP